MKNSIVLQHLENELDDQLYWISDLDYFGRLITEYEFQLSLVDKDEYPMGSVYLAEYRASYDNALLVDYHRNQEQLPSLNDLPIGEIPKMYMELEKEEE